MDEYDNSKEPAIKEQSHLKEQKISENKNCTPTFIWQKTFW